MSRGVRRLTSVFFARGNWLEFITEGTTFRRRHPGNMCESATVEKIYTDGMGIPHVRFSVRFDEPHRPPMTDGPRNLALKTFCEHYPERSAAISDAEPAAA